MQSEDSKMTEKNEITYKFHLIVFTLKVYNSSKYILVDCFEQKPAITAAGLE